MMAIGAWWRERAYRAGILTAAIGLSLIGPLAGPGPDRALAWPDRTVKLITPAAPGSHTDAMARLLADGLAKKWAQPVVVENQPGVDGIPAVRSFVTTRDDHALLYTFNSVVTVNPALHEKLPYSAKDDLVPISQVVDDFIALVASPALKIDTLAELPAIARATPGGLAYASFPGSPYLAFQAFQERAGVNLVFVPYRAMTGAPPDLMENRIQVGVLSLALVIELARSGKVKILALTSQGRAPIAPEIPTATELGFPELSTFGGHGLFARTSMPPEQRERVLRDVREVLTAPAEAQRIAELGFVLRATGPREHAEFLERETDRIAALVRELGPKARARSAM
jgi:tripartite-type tricarboxylate transporter receptor subunit TctC